MFRLGTGILTVASVVMLWAPGALAATPEEIYKDLADNGRLDGTYTQQELQAFVQSASVQGYGNPVVILTVPPATVTPTVTPPVVTSQAAAPPAAVLPAAAAPPAPASDVAGASKTIVKAKPKARPQAKPQPVAQVAGVATPVQAPLARTASAGTLPFTGAELAMFALVGAALLLGGILLRVSSRQR